MEFMLATGIECSAPMIAAGRRDQLVLTNHVERYAEDFDLVVDLGIRYLRYGVPFHLVARDPRDFDWRWTDGVFRAMRERGIEPIADLLHFGVPDDLSGFDDPGLVDRYVGFAAAFATRYPWVRWFTPVNEPYITAYFSGGLGWWNERQSSDAAFVRALANVSRCSVLGMREIRRRRSDAIFLQSDAAESFEPVDEEAIPLARALTERTYLGYDLTYGREVAPLTRAWLLSSGLRADELAWFERNGRDDACIVGLDYYVTNEHLVHGDGRMEQAERRGLGPIAKAAFQRYGLPLVLAETNRTSSLACDWLAEVWDDVLETRSDGIPIDGFCWYSLTDQVDWDTCLREANGTVNDLGLVDLERRDRPVARIYRQLAAEVASGSLATLRSGEAA